MDHETDTECSGADPRVDTRTTTDEEPAATAPPRIYAVGDPDPTPLFGDCAAPSPDGEWECTWDDFGHEHPQHVAGNRGRVAAVWPVAVDRVLPAPGTMEAVRAVAADSRAFGLVAEDGRKHNVVRIDVGHGDHLTGPPPQSPSSTGGAISDDRGGWRVIAEAPHGRRRRARTGRGHLLARRGRGTRGRRPPRRLDTQVAAAGPTGERAPHHKER